MRTWTVEWHLTERGEFEVEADTEAEARQKAYELGPQDARRSDFDLEVYEA